ncbi:MAG: glycerol-3-phosphate acyltransferase [Chloroflexi bacterium]|nr:MAG: glycerol-3-phosphate acyltransferase [Chloroflexota bacterium]
MAVVQAVLAGLIGYALGAIPVGLLICRIQGMDPRLHGSGRTGGTNVWRTTHSIPSALITVAGDVVKGMAPVFIARALFPGVPLAQALAGIGAVAGHNWSVYIRFGGGAGTMTNFGALFALSPLTCLVMIPVGLVTFLISRMASVASLAVAWAAFITLAILAVTGVHLNPFVAQPSPWDQIAYGIGQAALVTYALRPNIGRLLRGEERRVEY